MSRVHKSGKGRLKTVLLTAENREEEHTLARFFVELARTGTASITIPGWAEKRKKLLDKPPES